MINETFTLFSALITKGMKRLGNIAIIAEKLRPNPAT